MKQCNIKRERNCNSPPCAAKDFAYFLSPVQRKRRESQVAIKLFHHFILIAFAHLLPQHCINCHLSSASSLRQQKCIRSWHQVVRVREFQRSFAKGCVCFFLSFLLGCSRSHCTKSIHLALNNTKNDVKHVDTTKSLMIDQCSSTGEAIKVPPIVSFGAMITLFKITVQSARFLLGTKSTVFCW